MEKKNISIEKLKAIISMLSTGVLALQHFVGLFAEDIKISYIPLTITFVSFLVGVLGEKDTKPIFYVSLGGTALLVICGCITSMINEYGIILSENANLIYVRIMYFLIGSISFVLSALYIKNIIKIK